MLTTLLLHCVITAARRLTSPDSPLAVNSTRAATAIGGTVVGIVLVVLITSPPRRCSGARTNPTISIALWLMGAFPRHYVPACAVAQLAGSVAGTALGRLCRGRRSPGPRCTMPPCTPARRGAPPRRCSQRPAASRSWS
ncbi:aquaporin [Streptomyces sp. NPDC002265]|uniref:aquaporin n=1 Tax=Streptomyces sp. NPDC002265 TaxID=3154415 RepID=UPI00332AAE5A